jgi:histone acetyltransferase (RNA polymerase elongator complex component)
VKKVELLKILIKERALVRLLKKMGDKEYQTRELLQKVGSYGYGHKLLLKAEKNRLVERTSKIGCITSLQKKESR